MRFRAVLFDLDGTLLDTLEDLGTSMNSVLVFRGFPPHAIDSYRGFVGDGIETLVTRALPESRRGDVELGRRCVEEMRIEYGRRWSASTRPYPGIRELLDRLSAVDVVKAVLSNKPHSLTVSMVRHYFRGTRFCAVFGGRPEFPKKPDPSSALEISRITGVSPEGFVFLGDTNTDMLTARAAGMLPVGALWGFRTEAELQESGAARVIRHPMELIAALDDESMTQR
jgi:phosphoglycolate phosphatase